MWFKGWHFLFFCAMSSSERGAANLVLALGEGRGCSVACTCTGPGTGKGAGAGGTIKEGWGCTIGGCV